MLILYYTTEAQKIFWVLFSTTEATIISIISSSIKAER